MTSIKVLFEDQDIIVVNKPSGLVVNKAESVRGKTLQAWMEKKLRINKFPNCELSSDFFKRGGVVHRLDKETSGVMVLAKNAETFSSLQRQFKERKVKKLYRALVHGEIKLSSSRINLPLKRSLSYRRRFGVSIKGRPALTFYQRSALYQKDHEVFSYLKVKPQTGRTHQIRVHFQHLGMPVVSDPLYLGPKTLEKDRQWCPRLFLHSESISFQHPRSKKSLVFKATLAEDLKKALKELKKQQ